MPSFQKPTEMTKLVKVPNHVSLKYNDLRSVGETSVQAFCSLDLPYTPAKYEPENLKAQLMRLSIKLGIRSRLNQVSAIQIEDQPGDYSESSDDDGVHDIDKLQALQKLCRNDSTPVSFDFPVSFTIRQRVAPKNDIYKMKKETPVEELNNFRAQRIDIYLTSDPDHPPSKRNHQVHKVIQFTSKRCSGEFLQNPVYRFSVDFDK